MSGKRLLMDEPTPEGESFVADAVVAKPAIRGFRLYLAIACLAAFILSLYFIVRGKAFAFYDFGSDTFLCFYPLQVAVAKQLQTLHAVTWSFDLGLGAFTGALFDPLWLVTGWMPVSWQLPLRLPMFMLRLVAGGAFFYGYLRQIGLRSPIAVIGGLGYAFSNYGVINTQWEVMQGAEFVQFAAYLFFLERYMLGRKLSAGVAAGFTVGIGHPFGLYMFALFSIVYGAVRIATLPASERKSAVLAYLKFGLCCLPGIALTAPLLLPELYYLLDSPRVSGNYTSHLFPSSLFSLNDAATIGSEIGGLLGKDLIGSGLHYAGWQNYFEGPGFYVGLVPVLCLLQLAGPNATRRERLVFAIAIVGCALFFALPALRYAVYGFGHQAFRFSTLWISAMLLVLGLAGLQRAVLSGWWRPGIAIGATTILVIVTGAVVLVPGSVNFEHVARVLAFTLIYVAFALAGMTGNGRARSAAIYLLIAICACELTTFATPAIIERDAVGLDGSKPNGVYDDVTMQALQFIRIHDDDDNFYRIEKTYASVFLDDSLMQDYSGTASYYFHASSITRFVDRLALPRHIPHPNYIGLMLDRPDAWSLLGVRYVLTRNRSLDRVATMSYVAKVGDLDIYRNNAAHAFATLYDTIGTEAQADAQPVPQRDAFLLTTAIVEDLAGVNARLSALRATSLAPGVSRLAKMRKVRDDELRGEVATPTASLLLLAMPFDRGWNATLDGAPLELFRADYGLTAALVPAGTHTIALDYVPPGRPLGVALATGVLVTFTVFGLLSGGPGRTRARWRRMRQSIGLPAAKLRAAFSPATVGRRSV